MSNNVVKCDARGKKRHTVLLQMPFLEDWSSNLAHIQAENLQNVQKALGVNGLSNFLHCHQKTFGKLQDSMKH